MKSGFGEHLARRIGGRLYYGWVIVGVIFVSNLATFSANTSFGLFVTRFETDFGWSRSAIALAPTLGTVFGAIFAPMLGRAVDRFGVRPLMVGGGLFGATCYFLLGNINAIWQLYLLYGMMFGVLSIGAGFLVSNVTVTRWFVKRRGRAMAVVMMGSSLGGFVFISVQAFLIEVFDWRVALSVQGLFVVVLVVLPGWLLMVNAPEDLGMAGHRELSHGSQSQHEGAVQQGEDWTLREAMGVPTFWLVLGGIMMNNLMVAGYFANTVPHMESLGFSRIVAGSAWAAFFLVGVFAKFIWGFIVEYTTVRWGLVLLNLGEFLGLYLILTAKSKTDLYVWAVVQGFCHGPWLALSTQVWGDYFGRRSIGKIYGTVQPAIVLGGAVGPWLGGYIYDRTGDYTLFYQILMAMMLAGCLIYISAKPPVKAAPARQAAETEQ
ncbi:MAG: MFS transporter [SAR324 cluster bacterium]|nr:MFS transporter [SAR324 cluster bacterium]